MAFKLVESAQKHWRKLNGSVLLPEVIAGVILKNGMKLAAWASAAIHDITIALKPRANTFV